MKRPLVCVPVLLAALLAALATGCGVGAAGPVPAGAPASGLQAGTVARYARLYFVGRYGIQTVPREVDAATSPQQALDLLRKGPDTAERARILITEVPRLHGRAIARAAEGAVDPHLPLPVAQMSGGGLGLGLGLGPGPGPGQIVCTVASADVPGDRQPPDVDVRVYEAGFSTAWTVRCDAGGDVVPVPNR
ncbi:hypothetical protein JQK87_24230 [Streptomyces sp. G44]|uniref:hypothetical protein n=1 Tax=Streptomyces sp. G44 TaxID=2807632 RepID=UPI0019606999|nr:hypothetical protein [Streptomyces sp. G44]MBM7171457.1 hypothetical protein [Streptomyces sp. G44]